jgi:hypothetical protein
MLAGPEVARSSAGADAHRRATVSNRHHPFMACVLASVAVYSSGVVAFAGRPAGERVSPAFIRPSELSSDPERLVGRQIRVANAVVASVLARQVFTVKARSNIEAVPVIMPYVTPGSFVDAGDLVQLKGRVWPLGRELFEGWPRLESLETTLEKFAGRPVIVAESVMSHRLIELIAPGPPVDSIARIVEGADKPSLIGRGVRLAAVIDRAVDSRSALVKDEADRRILIRLPVGATLPPLGSAADIRGSIHLVPGVLYPWSLLAGPHSLPATSVLYVAATEVTRLRPTLPDTRR